MLNHCESHNIHKLRPWLRRILERGQEKAVRINNVLQINKIYFQLSQGILDNMSVIFRRLTDEQVEDACFDLLIFLLSGQDPHLKVASC